MAASREFVCIRPQTYESAEEAEVLRWVHSDRDGTLRNTSFGILSPDGKRKLSRTGRSPGMVYATPEELETALREIASSQKTARAKTLAALPELPDLRLALDVAAADLRPLVVAHSTEPAELERMRAHLEAAAWDEALIGRLRYVVVAGEDGLEGFEDMKLEPGISVVQPEAYGRGGQVLAHESPKASATRVERLLAKGLAAFDAPAKNTRTHVRDGARQGIEWESAIPVSDPGRRK